MGNKISEKFILRDRESLLECKLQTLAISMGKFLQILTAITEISEIVKENKDLLKIITPIRAYTQKELGFMCES